VLLKRERKEERKTKRWVICERKVLSGGYYVSTFFLLILFVILFLRMEMGKKNLYCVPEKADCNGGGWDGMRDM